MNGDHSSQFADSFWTLLETTQEIIRRRRIAHSSELREWSYEVIAEFREAEVQGELNAAFKRLSESPQGERVATLLHKEIMAVAGFQNNLLASTNDPENPEKKRPIWRRAIGAAGIATRSVLDVLELPWWMSNLLKVLNEVIDLNT